MAEGDPKHGDGAFAAMWPRHGARGTQSGHHTPEWEDADADAPWYAPKEVVGDIPYRYQGVALHGLAGLGGLVARMPSVALPNLGYAAYSYLTGRTEKRPNDFWSPPEVDTPVPASTMYGTAAAATPTDYPVNESHPSESREKPLSHPPMTEEQMERMLQQLGGWSGAASGASGALVLGEILKDSGKAIGRFPVGPARPLGAALQGAGTALKWVGAPAAVGAGGAAFLNADNPDIDEVWLHQLRKAPGAFKKDKP